MRLRASKLHGIWKEVAEKFGTVSKDGAWVEIGLGDVAFMATSRLASAIDKKYGTTISGCAGCKSRRDWLNKLTK